MPQQLVCSGSGTASLPVCAAIPALPGEHNGADGDRAQDLILSLQVLLTQSLCHQRNCLCYPSAAALQADCHIGIVAPLANQFWRGNDVLDNLSMDRLYYHHLDHKLPLHSKKCF